MNDFVCHFRTFRTFAKKCEKSLLFGPSRKTVKNIVVFTMPFWSFPHFCAKVGGEVILGEIRCGGPGGTGNRASRRPPSREAWGVCWQW